MIRPASKGLRFSRKETFACIPSVPPGTIELCSCYGIGVAPEMNSLDPLPRLLIIVGSTLLILGLALLASSKLGCCLFRLPGDIVIRRNNFTFYFPWVTGLVISILLSLILGLFARR